MFYSVFYNVFYTRYLRRASCFGKVSGSCPRFPGLQELEDPDPDDAHNAGDPVRENIFKPYIEEGEEA